MKIMERLIEDYGFLKICEGKEKLWDGREAYRIAIRHNGAVAIVCSDGDKVLLEKQHRYPIDMDIWEIPAGKVEIGEVRLDAAERELREETGIIGKNWEKLCDFYPAAAYCDEMLTVYKCEVDDIGERDLDEDEHIECKWFDMDEVKNMIKEGSIVDAKTLIGLLWE